jgi:hypothetical protein
MPFKLFRYYKRLNLGHFLWLVTFFPIASLSATWQPYTVVDSQKISDTFSGHPLDYSMLQHGDSLYMVFYDAQQRMTLGLYDLKSHKVTTQTLASTVGWDSHIYV